MFHFSHTKDTILLENPFTQSNGQVLVSRFSIPVIKKVQSDNTCKLLTAEGNRGICSKSACSKKCTQQRQALVVLATCFVPRLNCVKLLQFVYVKFGILAIKINDRVPYWIYIKKKIIKITYCLEPALELCTGLLKYLWKNYEYIV